MQYILSLFVISLVNIVLCAEFTNIRLCNYGEASCIKKSAQEIFKGFSKTGVPELNLIPFDPLPIKDFFIGRNRQSGVNLEMKFHNIELIGLGSATVKKFRGFDRDLKQTVEFDILVPRLVVTGPYEIDGKVLILPIVGKGLAKITLDDLTILSRFKFKKTVRNGQTFIQVDKNGLKMKAKRVTYSLDGLFNNNKDLVDNMHLFLNENWETIFEEMEPTISKGFSVVVKDVINDVFAKIPFEDLFLNGKE